MPIVKSGSKLIYYAHVPKCGGSSVEKYLAGRFGDVAFEDPRHVSKPATQPWSRTSPQHIDKHSLKRLFPASFFDVYFTIVRHPTARVVSAYHFQQEVERTVSEQVTFSDWLADLAENIAADNYIFDNHVRPMTDIVPDGAKVFHLEHGLDGLVPYLDDVTGNTEGPRAVGHANKRGAYKKKASGKKIIPSESDKSLISDLYAEDFQRFGYVIDSKEPLSQATLLPPEYVAARDAERRSNSGKHLTRIKTALKKRLM